MQQLHKIITLGLMLLTGFASNYCNLTREELRLCLLPAIPQDACHCYVARGEFEIHDISNCKHSVGQKLILFYRKPDSTFYGFISDGDKLEPLTINDFSYAKRPEHPLIATFDTNYGTFHFEPGISTWVERKSESKFCTLYFYSNFKITSASEIVIAQDGTKTWYQL